MFEIRLLLSHEAVIAIRVWTFYPTAQKEDIVFWMYFCLFGAIHKLFYVLKNVTRFINSVTVWWRQNIVLNMSFVCQKVSSKNWWYTKAVRISYKK